MYVYMYTGLSRGPIRDPEREFPHTNLSPVEKEPPSWNQLGPRWLAGNFRRTANYRPATYSVNPVLMESLSVQGLIWPE